MKIGKIFGRKTNYLNSQEFYQKHPDLAPKNVYLATGRGITSEQIDKDFNRLFKLSFYDKCKIVFSKVKQLFSK